MPEQNLITEEVKKLDHLFEHAKEYTEARLDLISLNIQEKLSEMVSAAVLGIIVGVFSFAVLLFLSMGAAWWLGKITGSAALGFVCVAGFYLVLALIVFAFRKSLINIPVINFFMKKINIHEKG